MTTRAVALNRRARLTAVKAEQARIRRAELERVRRDIALLKARKRAALERVRVQCRHLRDAARAEAKRRRREALERIRQEVRELVQASRNRCQARRHAVIASTANAIARKRLELRESLRHQRVVERAERHKQRELKRHTRAEARGESDDEVRRNIPAELVTVFDRIRRIIRGRPGMSRTEAFTHWVEEHPNEVWEHLEQEAHARLVALQKEERRVSREAERAHRAAHGSKRLARSQLPEAPF